MAIGGNQPSLLLLLGYLTSLQTRSYAVTTPNTPGLTTSPGFIDGFTAIMLSNINKAPSPNRAL